MAEHLKTFSRDSSGRVKSGNPHRLPWNTLRTDERNRTDGKQWYHQGGTSVLAG